MSHQAKQLSQGVLNCIDLCTECHQTCFNTAMTQCIQMGGKHIEPEHFHLMINCAEICQTSANVMLSGSTLHGAVCASCAEFCFACAESCRQVGDMEGCVQICQRCGESCEDMAKSFQFHISVLSSKSGSVRPNA